MVYDEGRYKVTLKKVVRKIEELDEPSKSEWVSEILKKFGRNATARAYHDGYEQGRFDEAMEYSKPKEEVPYYIDEWIRYCKKNDFTLLGALNPIGDFGEPLANSFKGDVQRCVKWSLSNSNKFADAWVNGYSVKKEKFYYVAVPVEHGRFRRLYVLANGEVALGDHNYESLELLKKHSRQATYQLTEKMIKESPLSWAWQFAKELEL